MIYPDKKKFIKLAKKYNLIPVYTEYFSDMETPVSVFSKIMDSNYSFILESVEGGRHLGRYSFIGSQPSLIFSSRDNKIKIEIKNKKFFKNDKFFKDSEYTIPEKNDPLDELKEISKKFKLAKDKNLNFRFPGGFIGYIGYDIVNFFEPVVSNIIGSNNRKCTDKDIDLPDCIMMLSDNIIIFDHLLKRIKIICNVYTENIDNLKDFSKLYKNVALKLKTIKEDITAPLKQINEISLSNIDLKIKKNKVLKSNFQKEHFINKVKKIKKYIKNGEIIQAVFSQRFNLNYTKNSLTAYRLLRAINPSPYMFLLKFKDFSLVGSSPEVMVRSENRMVELRPIAGTRPRGNSELEDIELEKDLLEDEKEKSEHIMLVDLGRNDLGKVCKYKTINVPELMIIEKYSHVLHIVSSVVGELRKDKDIFDLFKACFPAGTVTGAPKVRAMQIINELEYNKRGPYAGCIGYFSFSKNMDTCITIRTIVIKDNVAYIQAGAGIVADSIPEKEYQETINKAKALIETIQIAENN